MHKLTTVDVWDTLLRRDCHPECIKLSTALHIRLRFATELLPEFQDHWHIYRCRLDIEAMLGREAIAAAGDDEYALENVLRLCLARILGRDASWTELNDVLDYELAVEMARSFPDSEIAAVLERNPAERTIFLSDFYMSGAMLRRLLQSKGLDALVPDGISSCDIGKNKRSGNLFKHVHALYGIEPSEHFHVGDNSHSDVHSPGLLGINAAHFVPEKAHAERQKREMLFSSRDMLFEHIREEVLLPREDQASGLEPEQAIAFQLGKEAAPLFIGFALYIAEQALRNRDERICFLTREGEFFHQVYSLLHDDGEFFGHRLPASMVLEVSRLSTFAASMREVSVSELQRIWRLFRRQKLAGLFATLGLEAEQFGGLLASLGLTQESVIDAPESDTRMQALLSSETFQAAAREAIDNKRGLLNEYLAARGMSESVRFSVVDIGWRGTIQDNLALLLPHAQIQGYYLGLRQLINPQAENVGKHAYCVDERLDPGMASYFAAFAALEMICNSPNGSVEGYVREGARITAVRHVSEQENDSWARFSRYFQEGVLAATAVWKPYVARYVLTSADLAETARHTWMRLAQVPPDAMVDAFLHAPQHDVFGFGELYHRHQAPSLKTIVAGVLRRAERREVIQFIQRVQWVSAVRRIRGIGRFHRGVLTLLFVAAHAVKTSRRYRKRRK
jgi:FMN phosphatase YigB (HAD superfamily)